MIKILVVEDEKPISDLIRFNLVRAGYVVECAFDGLEAADLLENRRYDLILLDVMLPKINGYELMEYIRPMEIPVIFITAMGSLDHRLKGLTSGAEDYILKPFEIVELLARIHIVLRRYNKADTLLRYDDLEVDTEKKEVKKAGTVISLTKKEFDLLVLFIQNVDITLFRERIYETIWEEEYPDETRTLDLHINRLRKKTGLNDRLKTVFKVGYRLEHPQGD